MTKEFGYQTMSGMRAMLKSSFIMSVVSLGILPAQAAARTYIWPDCDATHPCVVHHIDTVSAGTAYGETLQDFKFPMVPSSAGNLLTFTVTHVSNKSVTVTDNNGGSWQKAVTTTNSSDGEESELLYICGAMQGTNLITIHLSEAAAHDEPLQFSYNEVSGVAPSSCLDGASGANGLTGTVQPGAITTTANGDLIYNFGEETYAYPEQDNPISAITPDSNSALLMENTFDKFASQVSVQSVAGAYNPTLTVTDPNHRGWNSVAAAFRASSGAGTQPTGIHVTRILHYMNPLGSTVQVPFPTTGNAIVILTSNPSSGNGEDMANLTDNLGDTYTRTPFTDGNTDPQIYYTCFGSVAGGQNLQIQWTPGSETTHVLIYDIAGAITTGGQAGCAGATAINITGEQPSTANANITGDPIITPAAANSVVLATSYFGIGPPSASLTPNAVFNSIWATGMIDASDWDTGDPYAYIYTTSTSPISFDWQMANANGLPDGGSYFDGGAIEILAAPVSQNPLKSIAVAPTNPSIATAATQQFTATGTYSDGTTEDISTEASWISSATTVATISSAGLATGVCAGNTTITASLSSVSNQTTLAVAGLGATSTVVSSNANPSTPGQSVTFMANVTATCGTPTGTVQFVIDGANYSSPVALGGGAASVSATLASGSHTVVGMYSGDTNFAASSSPGLSQNVNSSTPTLKVANSPVIYNGNPQTATISSSVAGTVSNVLYSGSSAAPSTAGTYAVTANFTPTDSKDYSSLTGASAGNFVINPATPTLMVVNPQVTYTGSPQTATLSSSVTGTVSNELYSGSATAPIAAGTYAITANFVPTDTTDYVTLTGAAAGSFVINPATTTPTLAVTNSPVTYNGNPQTATISGSVPGTVRSVRYSGSSTVPTKAGTYAITANFTPTDTVDYKSLTQASAGNFVISKATPTMSVTNSPVTYNGHAQAASVSGSVSGSASNVLYNGSSTAPSAVGTYAITANFIPSDTTDYNSLSGASAGSFVINPEPRRRSGR